MKRLAAEMERELESLKFELERQTELTQELADSEARYRSLFNALTEGVVMQGQSGEILTCNRAAEEILALTRDEMQGKFSTDPHWHAIRENGAEYPGSEHPAMETLRTGVGQRHQLMGVGVRQGEITWLSINTEPVELSDGTRAVISSFTDISSLRAAADRIERNEGMIHLALRAAHLGLWEWNIDDNHIVWTPTVYEIFGIDPATELNMSVFEGLIHPEDRAGVQRAITDAFADSGGAGAYQVEHRINRPDGTERWVRGHGQVVFDSQSKPVSMRGAVLDITEQKRLEEKVRHTERMESIGRLAGGISHDFNNLLTAAMCAIDLGRRSKDEASLQNALATVETACRHASELTKQLLSFAHQSPLKFKSTNLDALLRETHTLLRHLLREDIELQLELGAGEWCSRIDATQLQQVVVNLAANARDAMPDGGTLKIVSSRVAPENSPLQEQGTPTYALKVTVSDTGSGMGPEVVKRIFDPFYTTKQSGHGLGLATSYGIVLQSGGQIECHSVEGVGTSFDVYLPRYQGKLEDMQVPGGRPQALQGKRTLVLVEDQKPILDAVSLILQSAGFEVHAYQSASEACAALQSIPGIDLLVTDLVMPGMSGLRVAEKLRESLNQVPVLFMTGHATKPELEKISSMTSAALLEKPFDASQLVGAVTDLLCSA